jgi:hypothetical protein
MIRGQKLINEIDNYYTIYNKYPNDFTSIDQNDILYIYKKVFPDEDIYFITMNFPQPYYREYGNCYILSYMLGWSDLFTWVWLFIYDSSTKRWEIGHLQYAPRN